MLLRCQQQDIERAEGGYASSVVVVIGVASMNRPPGPPHAPTPARPVLPALNVTGEAVSRAVLPRGAGALPPGLHAALSRACRPRRP